MDLGKDAMASNTGNPMLTIMCFQAWPTYAYIRLPCTVHVFSIHGPSNLTLFSPHLIVAKKSQNVKNGEKLFRK